MTSIWSTAFIVILSLTLTARPATSSLETQGQRRESSFRNPRQVLFRAPYSLCRRTCNFLRLRTPLGLGSGTNWSTCPYVVGALLMGMDVRGVGRKCSSQRDSIPGLRRLPKVSRLRRDIGLREEIKSLKKFMKLLAIQFERTLWESDEKAKSKFQRLSLAFKTVMQVFKKRLSCLEKEVREFKNRLLVLEEEVEKLRSIDKRTNAHEKQGLRRGNVCDYLRSREGRPRRFSHCPGKTQLILNVIGRCKTDSGCLSLLKVISIYETGMYTMTLGGAGGGSGYGKGHGYQTPGRGAVVKVTALLKKGTRLAIVAGCGGRSETGSKYGGYGGNATILADRSHGVLLAIAGGGGGASHVYPGMHGQAGEAATDTWDPDCKRILTPDRILRTHFSERGGGLKWPDVRQRILYGLAGEVVGTGGRSHYNGGGGGGGFNGGGSLKERPGGGGGSYCNDSAAWSCAAEEGGNHHCSGYVLVHKHLCP